MKLAPCLALCCFALLTGELHALPMVDRTIVPDPFDFKIEGQGGFLQRSSSWGDFARYLSSTDEDHSYDAKLGAYVELFRLRNLWSVDAASEIELVANPANDIQFQPRVFFWQESIFAMQHLDFLDWGIGYYHRCRHDIDNLAQFQQAGLLLERVCIYDSVTLRAYPLPLRWNWGGGAAGSARFTLDDHYFVLRVDDAQSRYGGRQLTLTDLVDSLALGLELEPLRLRFLACYVAFKVFTDLYGPAGQPTLSSDYLAETGIRFRGAGARLAFYLRYERFAETLMDPWRQTGTYLSFGIRVE